MYRKVLFISHDDSRTGAPILLLNLCNAISQIDPSVKVHFLLKNSCGQIHKRFVENGITFVLNYEKKNHNILNRIYNRIIKKRFFFREEIILKKMNLKSYDLILSNTITNGDILPLIRKYYDGVIVSYIHELKMASNFFTNKVLIEKLIANSNYFAYPSSAVKDFLNYSYLISSDKMFYLPYYIPKEQYIANQPNSMKSNNCFVIGGCGTTDWRKGFDVFILLVNFCKEKYPDLNLKFVWKGAINGIELSRAYYDIEKAGLREIIELHYADDNMNAFWQSLDIFLLTSREDPFPLVVLEAAKNKIPTIAFNESGGATEFISTNAGVLVPYLSIEAMAEAIIKLVKNKDLCDLLSYTAYNKINSSFSNSKFVFSYFECLLNLKIKSSEPI